MVRAERASAGSSELTLTASSLIDCRLGAAAIELIATALESNALLNELFIRGALPPFRPPSRIVVLRQSSLFGISSGTGVDVAHMRRIIESLERNTNLRSLAIAG